MLGGRFEVVARAGATVLGDVFKATDKKTGKTIALRILPRTAFGTASEVDALRQNVKLATTLTHKNVVATFGMGVDPGGVKFVATELVDGHTLRESLAERHAQGRAFGLHAAYNVVALVCNAVGYAQTKIVHGGLSPDSVLVGRSGRVKVADFGILVALPAAERQRVLQARGAEAYVAPEAATQAPTPAADVYAIGVLFFELLVGRVPSAPTETLSAALPGLGPELDGVLAQALAPRPDQRFAAAADLKAALHAVVAATPTQPSESNDLDGIDVEIDVEPTGEQRLSPVPKAPAFTAPAPAQRPAAPPPPARGAPAPPAPVEPPPKVGARMAVDAPVRASVPPGASPDAAQVVDLAALLGEITAHDAERWMVQKDRLDHGPFSARELVQQILRGEVLEDHIAVNMDSGERKKVRAWAEFKHFAEEYRVRKAKQDAQVALEKSVKTEKHGNAAKILLAVIILVVIGGGTGVYFWSRQAAGAGDTTPDELADLFAAGRIEIKGAAGILPTPRGGFRRGGGRPGGGARAVGPGGSLSYEDAMNQAVDLGNVEQGGGEQTLTAQQVAGTMNGNVRRFARCIGIEGASHNVSMSLAIAGSGQIVGATVSSGSPAFQQCVAATARGIRMPPFSAPRMGASYNFSW
ncbi:MAG: protein kinase [Micrococcales bacterium]|nr:protein kinase [Micrococcales bacterium]